MQIHTHGAHLQAKSHCLEFILCSHNVEVGKSNAGCQAQQQESFSLGHPSSTEMVFHLYCLIFFEILEYLRLNVIYVVPTHDSLVLMTWSCTPNRHQEV